MAGARGVEEKARSARGGTLSVCKALGRTENMDAWAITRKKDPRPNEDRGAWHGTMCGPSGTAGSWRQVAASQSPSNPLA